MSDPRPPVRAPDIDAASDLQPDVERLHRAILREPTDPIEGREPMPWWFVATAILAVFWGGWYLGRYGGEWGTRTHIALGGGRQSEIAGAAAGAVAAAAADPVAQGERLFLNNCQGCHQASGLGVPGAFPPVVGSEWVTGPADVAVRIVLHGLQGAVEVAGATYNGAMPAWKDVLKDDEIAAVLTYLRQKEPNAAPAVSGGDVASLRKTHASRTTTWTAAELKQLQGGTTSPPATATPPLAPPVTPATRPAPRPAPTPKGRP